MYEYYKKITIDNTKVLGSSNHSSYPMLFKTTDNWLKTVANGGNLRNANGYDLVFKDGPQGSILSHEIQRYNAATGEMICWVKIPTLKYNEDTNIYAVYGNSEISTSQENISDVWSNNYQGVWHLKESGNGTASEFKDSTGSYDGTGGDGDSGETPTRAEGNIGYCQSFDGNDFITMGNVLGKDYGDSFTYSNWIKTTDTSCQIMGKGNWGNDTGVWFWIQNDGALSLYLVSIFLIFTYEKIKDSSAAVNDNNWNLVTVTYNGNSNPSGMNLYLNGDLMGVGGTTNDATTGSVNSSVPFNISGANNGQGGEYTGLIGHSRVSSGVYSADLIKTEHNNQDSPSTFYSVGGAELLNNAVFFGCNF